MLFKTKILFQIDVNDILMDIKVEIITRRTKVKFYLLRRRLLGGSSSRSIYVCFDIVIFGKSLISVYRFKSDILVQSNILYKRLFIYFYYMLIT